MPMLPLIRLSILAIGCGLSVWAIGALAVFLLKNKRKHNLFTSLLFAGGLLLGVGASLCYAWSGYSFDLTPGFYFGLAPLTLHIDVLAAFFIGMVAVIVCLLAIFSPSYLNCYRDGFHAGIYWSSLYFFLIALVLALLSSNAICFLVFWEIMSLMAMVLIASDHVKQRSRHAALIYLGVTTISTVLIMGAFLWYYRYFHSWNFSDWHAAGALVCPAVLLFFGLAVKGGIWPFHIWMSYAQSEAPSPMTALMSTVMKKAAIYVFIRLLVIDNDNGAILGYLALFFGTISVVWGSLFALLERDLKRLLSYSSVENVGLIMIAISICLLAKVLKQADLAYLSLAAALFHCVNHCLIKTGLFMGAGSVEAVTHTRDLAFLGGLAKRLPWTTACFVINGVSIVALPPFNGFASKWMIYQSLLKLASFGAQTVDRAIALIVVGILALVGAMTLACYTKAIGICFLGRERSEVVRNAKELTFANVIGQIICASLCLLLGLTAPQVVLFLFPVCAKVLPGIMANDLFSLPMLQLALFGVLLSWTVFCILSKFGGRAGSGLKKYITWDCGYGNLPARAEETGTSFSESIARIFAPVLRYRMITEIKGKDRRHFPEVIKFETVTSPLLEESIYHPTMKIIQGLSKAVVGFQTGSIHLYLLYVFITLVVMVGVGIWL